MRTWSGTNAGQVHVEYSKLSGMGRINDSNLGATQSETLGMARKGGEVTRKTRIGGILQFAMALVVLITTISRPPGLMLGVDGDTISYVICSGGDVKTITVSLDGDHDTPEQVDPECAFFASQTAAVPNQRINPTRMLVGAKVSQSQFIADLKVRQPARLSNAVRAPPLGTELS